MQTWFPHFNRGAEGQRHSPLRTDVWNWVMGAGAGSVIRPVHLSTESLLSARPPMFNSGKLVASIKIIWYNVEWYRAHFGAELTLIVF